MSKIAKFEYELEETKAYKNQAIADTNQALSNLELTFEQVQAI